LWEPQHPQPYGPPQLYLSVFTIHDKNAEHILGLLKLTSISNSVQSFGNRFCFDAPMKICGGISSLELIRKS
jgi:hypothetical protein